MGVVGFGEVGLGVVELVLELDFDELELLDALEDLELFDALALALAFAEADARAWAINFGATRTTCWLAESRSRSKRAERLRQSSMPHSRSSPNSWRAQVNALR